MKKMENVPDLTVKEKILLHLHEESISEWRVECPEELTQRAIADIIGVSRPHVSQALISLEEEGMVEEKKSRIKGHKRKKKAYRLTREGKEHAEDLKECLSSVEIEIVKEGETVEREFDELRSVTKLSIIEVYHEVSGEEKISWEGLTGMEDKGAEDEDEEEEKEEVIWDEKGDEEESLSRVDTSEESGSRSEAVLGLALVFLIPLSLIYLFGSSSGDPYDQFNFFCCFAPFFGMIFGLGVVAHYFSGLDERDKLVEQIFSGAVLLNLGCVLFVTRYMSLEVYGNRFLSYLLVLVSLIIAAFLPLEGVEKHRKEVAFISSSFLLAHGAFSFLFSSTDFASPFGPYWILAGLFMLDIGLRWYKEDDWWQDILVGASLYLVVILGWFLFNQKGDWEYRLTILLWMILGLALVSTRIMGEKRSRSFFRNIWNGLPVSLTVIFGALGLVLLVLGKYVEGMIEIFLSLIFLFSLSGRGGLSRKEWLTGLGFASIIGWTIYSLIFL